MGLDNGIILKANESEDWMNIYCPYYDSKDDFHHEGYCIAYWRKCWGIRDAILHKLDPKHIQKDGGHYKIEYEDIGALIRALKPFLSRDYWEEKAESIWDYDEYFDNTYHILIRLEWLKDYMKEHPDVECYFYDSF